MGRPFSAFATAGYTQPGTGPTRYGNQTVGLSLGSAYQWHFSSLSNADQNAGIARMQAAGVTWVRMDVAWDGVEYNQGTYDWSYATLTAAPMVAAGINVLMILLRAPSWALALNNNPAVPGNPFPTISPTDYAAFCGAAAAHFGPMGVSAYEIWNEPNLDSGDSGARLGLGYLSPVGYASLATAAYSAIHSSYVPKAGGAPTATVVGGALAGWARLDWTSTPRGASWSAVPAGAASAAVTCATAVQDDLYKLVSGSSVSVSPSGTAGSWPAGTYVSAVTSNGYVVSPPPWMSAFPAVNASSTFPTGVGNGVFGVEFGYPPDVFLTQAYAAAQGPMFDALSFHPYVWQLDRFHSLDAGAWGMVPELRQIMVDQGDGAKPLWFTELGAPTGQAVGTWPATAAGAAKLTVQGSAAAEDVGALVGVQGIPLHSYVAAVATGTSWTVLPPTGLSLADQLTPGSAVTTLTVALASSAPGAVTVPAGTTLTVWFGDGNGYPGDGSNLYALPPMTVTTTAQLTVSPGSTAALAIGQTTVPPILHGIISTYPSGGLVQCATSLGQTWAAAVPAATRSALNLVPPGVLATWSLPSPTQSPKSVSSEEQQALVVAASFQAVVSQPWPYVGPMFVFCWSDIGLGASAGPFGLTRLDGSAKPALGALAALARNGGNAPGIGLPGYVGDGP